MRKLLGWIGALVLLGLVAPPLWFSLFPGETPQLGRPDRTVEILGGQKLHLIDEGEGPVVVLVHGLPGMASDWQETSRALAERGFRVIALDRAGYGHSDPRPPDARHTVRRNAEEVLAALSALGLERPGLVGWSYGGVISMWLAERHPERIGHLVLVGTGGPDSAEARPPEPAAAIRFLYSDPVLAWRTRVPPVTRGLITAISRQAFSDQAMPDWWIPQVQANFARRHTLHTYRGEMFTLEGQLQPAGIRVPTLLLHGDDDRLAPIGIARYLAETIPGAELRVFEGGSHMLPVVRAGAVADAVAAFLR